ncbi:MAG TPA: MFS transporter, partial [Acidimicrobiales bacterium]|nr:MFS transporter [Acidimicrobiales bacterium]
MAHSPKERRKPLSEEAAPSPLGRRFKYLWASFALSGSGDGFAYGAVPLLAVVVDRRYLAVASVAAADSLPWLLLALPAGAFADRFERGRVMAVANTARGVLLAVMALLVGFHRMNLALLIVAVLANGAARAVYYSAYQATLPELVPPRSLAQANGILNGTESATEHLAGPIFGAIAFAAARALPFAVDASAVGLSGISLFGLRTRRPDPAAARGSPLDGARWLMRDKSLRLLVGFIAALAGLQGLAAGVLVLVAIKDWGVHPAAYGAFLAAGAAGNVPGALLADRLASKIGNVRTLVYAALLSGLAYLAMAASHTWLLAGAAFILVGGSVAAGSVIALSLRQLLTPDEVMGRVGAAWRGIVWGAAPVGALAAGGLALLGGNRLPLILAGSAQCAVALLLAKPLRRHVGAAMPIAGTPAPTLATSGPADAGDPGPADG